MKNDKNALKELQHSLNTIKGNLHILEVNVPVEKQMEYFRYSEVIRNNFSENPSVDEQLKVLSSSESSTQDVKYALAFLAVSGNVKAFRAIETYNKTHFSDWAKMAYIQAKMTLESEFSDEKQFFISTGLGGKGEQLRFFAFFKSKDGKNFSDYQKQLIEKELFYCIQNHNGILEELQIRDSYFTLLFLIHIQVDIKTMLEDFVDECNQYGDFLHKGFVITNVKIFSDEEIQNDLIKKI